MEQRNGSLFLSPSDLNSFLECEHLTQLELAVARRELVRPADENPQADLVKRKGESTRPPTSRGCERAGAR